MEITSDNLEQVLSRIVHTSSIKITALSPITYLNLNTDEQILRTLAAPRDLNSAARRKVVASKSTTVVKGDRVKFSDQAQLTDEAFIYVMILSLENEKSRHRTTNPGEKVKLNYPTH